MLCVKSQQFSESRGLRLRIPGMEWAFAFRFSGALRFSGYLDKKVCRVVGVRAPTSESSIEVCCPEISGLESPVVCT